jgi:hypothetical protein
MPSSKNYKRNYEQEAKTAKARGENADDAERHKLRREAVKAGKVKVGDGKDLDHVKPLSKGGANTLSNARETNPSANRSFSRNPDGSLKSQTSKKERKAK